MGLDEILLLLVFVVGMLVAVISLVTQGEKGESGGVVVTYFLGVALSLLSMVMPWVAFSPLQYFQQIPNALTGLLSDILAPILERYPGLVSKLLSRSFSMLDSVASVPGWLFPLLSNNGFVVRLVPVVVGGIGIASFVWGILAMILWPSLRTGKRTICACQLFILTAAMMILIWSIPYIDSWLDKRNLLAGIAVAVMGAHVGIGVWYALCGLVLMWIGCALDMMLFQGEEGRGEKPYELS